MRSEITSISPSGSRRWAASLSEIAPVPMKWWDAIRGLSDKRSTPLGRRSRLGAGWLFAAAALLTALMAAPVLVDPSTRLFGSEIEGRHADPFTVIEQFESPRLPDAFTQPVTDYPGAALAALFGGGVAAYNLVVLLSFPLAALFTGLLAFRLTGSVIASWLAGLAYAFAPFHIAHAAYHPQVAQTQWLPLYLLALWLCLARASTGRMALLAGSASLLVMSNFYFGLIGGLLTPIALVGFVLCLRTSHPEWDWRRHVGRTAATLGVFAVACMVWAAVMYRSAFAMMSALSFPSEDLARYSAHWFSYLVPPWEHPVFAAAVQDFWLGRGLAGLVEQQLTLGFGLLILATVPVAAWVRGQRDGAMTFVPALTLLAASALVLSLLTPATRLLHGFLPMFRAYARFGVVVLLAVAVLAGLGVDLLRRRGGRRAIMIGGLLVLLVAVELAPIPPWRWRDVLPTASHRFLSGQTGPVNVIDCVPGHHVGERTSAGLFTHDIRLLASWEDCGDPDFGAKLAGLGVSHLVVRRPSGLSSWLTRHEPAAGLDLERDFGDSLLFTVDPAPPEVYAEIAGGFYWREYTESSSYRWMGEAGRLTVVNSTDRPQRVELEMELQAFPRARALVIEVDGRPVDELAVYPLLRSQPVGPFVLEPGRHTLTLTTRTPPMIADEVLGNGDGRSLSIALGAWSVETVGD